MSTVSEQILLDAVAARRGDNLPWLAALRGDAGRAFAKAGLPTRRIEAWKYSDLRRALSEAVPDSADAIVPAVALGGAARATFVDGRLDEADSDLAGLEALPLVRALTDPPAYFAEHLGRVNPQEGHGLTDLNTALMDDGLILRYRRGAMARPLQLRFIWRKGDAAQEGHHLRLFLLLESEAVATVLETHEGTPGFASVVGEAMLGKGAHLTHVRMERLGAGGRQAAVLMGSLDRDARYEGFFYTEGAGFSRHEALLRLAGEGAAATLNGVALVTGPRHCDNTTVVDHQVPSTVSTQTFRSVLSGHARGVFQGRISVHPDAQKADARQMSRALLLSHHAEIATKPELEILADDVKCAHGATAGELDAAALFFLRARGIPEAEARALLVEGFLEEALASLGDDALRAVVAAATRAWLTAHAGEVAHVE